MTNDEIQQLRELKEKTKLNATEKAQVKILERKEKQAEKKNLSREVQRNVFATKPTTKIQPLPVRFSTSERSGLTELANDIKSTNLELIITELGSEREVNDTKLIRAAILLLKERSHAEIIDAIKQVKLNMIR